MLAAAVGGLLLIVASGCGGGSDYREPAATPTPSPEPSALTDLDRFHYVATLALQGSQADGSANNVTITTEGDYQSPDRHAFTYTTQLQGGDVRQAAVVIGEKLWLRVGDDPWHEATPSDPQAERLLDAAFSPIRPGFLGGPEFRQARESVRRLPGNLEFVNELRAYHYQVGPEGIQYFQEFLVNDPLLLNVQNMHWDVWLAEQGAWPVRLAAAGTVNNNLPILQQLDLGAPTDWTLRIDISRPNDPTISVQPPA
jgi:hypothetical protein